jgi:predicted DCC family thiol-disulfide oxidoreductase YuxK
LPRQGASSAGAILLTLGRVKSWQPQTIDGVPDGVILIDGVCVLCSRGALFVIARDPAAIFRFVTVQEPYGRRLAERLGIDAEQPETNAVILGGRAYFKSDAAIEALALLPGWSWVRVMRLVPRALRHAAYDLVARNRYRWFGRADHCLLPTADLARHFLAGDATLR